MQDDAEKAKNETPVAEPENKVDTLPTEDKPKASSEQADDTAASDVKKPEEGSEKPSWHHRLRLLYTSHKKYSIPLTVFVLLIIIAAVPFTRFQVAGLVLKQNFSIKVIDSKAFAPVSGADVTIGAIHAQTGGDGVAHLKDVKVGNHTAIISKKYYTNQNVKVLVPILKQKTVPTSTAVATGRQVKINVKNYISKVALADVSIKVLDITATTDSSGSATIVLPAGTSTQTATLALEGYNDNKVSIGVSDSEIRVNNFTLTPTGSVYFLSKRTGKLDVMKSNLDGTKAVVVLPGTGDEDSDATVLTASPDKKHVALLSKRDTTGSPKLYVIDTSSDTVSTADEGKANFNIIGWTGNYLVYIVVRSDIPSWQAGQSKLKSYDAGSGSIAVLDQSSAAGDANTNYSEAIGNVYLAPSLVIYSKTWGGNGIGTLSSGKSNGLHTISPDGKNQKVVSQYDSAQNYVSYVQHSATSIYIGVNALGANSNAQYYDYTFGGAAPKSITLTSDQFYKGYPSYIFSPNGKQTLWGELRDGQTAVLLGDSDGNNSSAIATLDKAFSAEGWYSDQYVLLSKDGTALYIMGIKNNTPIKITDYQPSRNYSQGY